MKQIVIATNGVWGLNFLAAFGIFLFAFIFLLFPPRRAKSDYAAQVAKTPPPKADDKPPDRGKFAPAWAAKLGDVTAKPVAGPSGLETKVEVAGVMRMTERKKSLAFINIMGGEQQRVKEGDSVLGAKVVEIRTTSVVFDDGGKPIELFTKRAALNMKMKGPSTNAGKKDPSAPGEFTTKKVNETADKVEWEIDPREIDFVDANAEAILASMKLRPFAVEGGEFNGLMIDDLTPGSFGAERGFLKGDVVKEVNGAKIASIEDVKKLAEADAAKGKDTITIKIERAGRSVDFVFKVK
jgi:type II secretory pathway component PulC